MVSYTYTYRGIKFAIIITMGEQGIQDWKEGRGIKRILINRNLENICSYTDS